MLNWTRIEQLTGETIREIGILVFVFAPLDAAFTGQAVDRDAVIGIMGAALALICTGVVLQSRE